MLRTPTFAILLFATAAVPVFGTAALAQTQSHTVWVASWSASQQVPEPQNALPPDDMHDATLRQIVHLSIGGDVLRVHLSNAFGIVPLRFTSVHIAHPIAPDSSSIDPATDKALSFNGKPDILIPPGAEYVSDPITYSVAPLSDVAITFHLDGPPAPETSHPGSRATSYYLHGDSVTAESLPMAGKIDHWYQLNAIDVQAPKGAALVIALGDSITDGHGATTNGNDRWTDVLARRLQELPATRNIAVSNQGIGGNHLLIDGLGPNALARFDRDVLAPAGSRWLIVFEGINDIGGLVRMGTESTPAVHAALVDRMIGAYQQIIERAHAHGIMVIGATLTPDGGSSYNRPGSPSEADRQAVNDWIRAAGNFDAVVDFDKVVRDPSQPDRLLPAFDCGDHLHPSPAGYKSMGEAISLSLFTR